MRLAGLPLAGMVDVKAWKAWSEQAASTGVEKVYGPPDGKILKHAREKGGGLLALLTEHVPWTYYFYRGEQFYVDYPPGSILLLWVVGKLYAATSDGSGAWLNVLLNTLHVAGSVAMALILRRTAPGPVGPWRALVFWCNPALLLGSILAYQDTIFGALALLAVLALVRGEHVQAAALTVGAGMLKPQAVLLVPTLLALLVARTRPATWLRAGLAGAGVAAVVFAPWWTTGYLLSAVEGCLRPLSEKTLSAQALNVWWIAGWVQDWAHRGPWPLARIVFLDEFAAETGWPVRGMVWLLLLAGTAANVVLLLRSRLESAAAVPLSVIVQTHLYAAFATSVHENHTYLAVMLAPLLLGVFDRARPLLALVSAYLFASLFLLEGLGRTIIPDRKLFKLRLLAGLDLTVIVAALQVALLALLFYWMARGSKAPSPPASPGPPASAP